MRNHPTKGTELRDGILTDHVQMDALSEGKREFTDVENKRWVQERLLDYYHGSRG